MNNAKRITDLERTLQERRDAAAGPRMAPICIKFGDNAPEIVGWYRMANGVKPNPHEPLKPVMHLGNRELWEAL